MTEGKKIRSHIRRLLKPLGLAVKGGDGVHDLKSNGADLLGFTVRMQGDEMVCGLREQTYDNLRIGLTEAHGSSHPYVTARAVADGWIESCGPALETGHAVLSRVISLLCETGFHQLADGDRLSEVMRHSRERWREVRNRMSVT